jgi:hypothetical protein
MHPSICGFVLDLLYNSIEAGSELEEAAGGFTRGAVSNCCAHTY